MKSINEPAAAGAHQVACSPVAAVGGLASILPSIDALNSYVRSDVAWRLGNLKHCVYHYKREALKALPFAHRLVVMHGVSCDVCGGTGRYCHYEYQGNRYSTCRRCSGRGVVRLDFIESVLGDVTWHSPTRDAYGFAPGHWTWPSSVALWCTRQKGRSLTGDQVAEHMMAIEASALPKPSWYHSNWQWDTSRYYPHEDYTIYVGRSRYGECVLCNGAAPEHPDERSRNLGLTTGRITWTGIICSTCNASAGGDFGSLFNRAGAKLPAYFLTPNIVRWIETHPVRRPA